LDKVFGEVKAISSIDLAFWVIVAVIIVLLFSVLVSFFERIANFFFNRSKEKKINDNIQGIIRADNEFVSKREEIENKAEEEKGKLDKEAKDNKDLIDKDPLEYIKKEFK
jgi:predicted PurR-regulated permease PerM